MPVQFKFRGEKAFRTLLNVSTPCTVLRVKNAIFEQARINPDQTDLQFDDAATGAPFDAKKLMTQDAVVQVVVRRTPIQSLALALPSLEPDTFGNDVVDTPNASFDLAEDLAIDRVVDEHEQIGQGSSSSKSILLQYSRSYRLAASNRAKQREGYDGASSGEEEEFEATEPPPPNYTCHRCGKTGTQEGAHWIWECPTNDDPDHTKKVRTARGVPRDFLRKVTPEEAQELSYGGVTFTLPGHSGHYIFAHEASIEDKKMRLGDTVKEKVVAAFTDGARKIEETLKCPLCNQMFRQAVLVPCCGATFCGDCVTDRLASASVENSRCPGCRKEVFPHQLVANEDIRKQVEKIQQASKAAAIAKEKAENAERAEKEKAELALRPKTLDIKASLKDRVNRPKKHGIAPLEDSTIPIGSDGAVSSSDGNKLSGGGIDPSWEPLGFGAMLSMEQWNEWQRLARIGFTPESSAHFAGWQRHILASLPPPASALPPSAPPASIESLQSWQHAVGEARPATFAPPIDPALCSIPSSEPVKHKKDKKDKKDKKERREKHQLATQTLQTMPIVAASIPIPTDQAAPAKVKKDKKEKKEKKERRERAADHCADDQLASSKRMRATDQPPQVEAT
mmetsp:Transcript_102631/g.162151  ORF Transcript_102631/g.162151 Transcript_102631/m.162151 type:complete len:622 (+) Transcript_102631:42-1907(+)